MSRFRSILCLLAVPCIFGSVQAYAQSGSAAKSTQMLNALNADVAKHPDSAGAFLERGNFYSDALEDELAKKDYLKAIEIRPDFGTAYMRLGELYYERGNPQLGLTYLLKGSKYLKSIKKGRCLRFAGRCYLHIKEYKSAEKTLTEALLYEAPTSRYLSLIERAKCYNALAKYKETIADINDASASTPGHVQDMMSVRAEAEMHLNQYQNAANDLTRAISDADAHPKNIHTLVFSSDVVPYYKMRAECYKKLGKLELAKRDLDAATDGSADALKFAPFR